MAKKEVWFVMKDAGGTNNVLPVALCMRKLWGEHCRISIIADQNGKANEFISKYHVQFLQALSPGYCSEILGSPDLIITSMCSGESLGRNLVNEFRGKCPTVAMPDSPWGRYQEEWRDQQYWPDWLIVNDEVCMDNVVKIWTEFPQDRIKLLGWPYLDRYYKYDLFEASGTVERFCGAAELPVVTFIGQLEGTSKVLEEVIIALNAIDEDIYFIPRFHPRCTQVEKNAYKWVLEKFHGGQLILDSSGLDTSTLIAGSDIVVSVYSLSLIEAAALRRQGISVVTEVGYQMFRADLGDWLRPCFGEAGYSCEVHNLAELTIALQKGIKQELYTELRPLQEEALIIDGKNAERVASFLAHDILNI